MVGGYAGKIAFVDLTKGEIKTETLDQDLVRQYIGGHGLGARLLFERQKKGIDPLGSENILGFTTGPLTGTKTPTGGRYMAVCKSPLTGGWGDANSGGFFGNFPFVDFFNAVTGWNLEVSEVLTAGERIQTLRQCFNVREGIKPSDVKLPERMAGRPPQKEGPVAGITLDIDNLAREYRQAMGWDPHSGKVEDTTLEKLGLTQLIHAHG